MKILTPGHKYELANFESKETPGQVIQFIEKAPVQPDSTEFETVHDGTTNEEMLDVLIDRLDTMNKKFPCRENAIAITNLEQALMWLNKRTENRRRRGVEGRHVA